MYLIDMILLNTTYEADWVIGTKKNKSRTKLTDFKALGVSILFHILKHIRIILNLGLLSEKSELVCRLCFHAARPRRTQNKFSDLEEYRCIRSLQINSPPSIPSSRACGWRVSAVRFMMCWWATVIIQLHLKSMRGRNRTCRGFPWRRSTIAWRH